MSDNQKINALLLSQFLACIVVVGFGLKFLKMIIVPVSISYIFFVMVDPVVTFLDRKVHISRSVYSLLVIVTLIALLTFTGRYLTESVEQLSLELRGYLIQLQNISARDLSFIQRYFPEIEVKELLKEELALPFSRVLGHFSIAFKEFVQITFLSFVASLFFLFSPFSILSINKVKNVKNFTKQLRKYFFIKSLASLTTAFLIVLYLYFRGYEFLLLIGLATIILNFIPSFGSIIAIVLLIPIMATETNTVGELLLNMIFPMSVHFIIGNLLEPKFMGDSLRLGPVIIIFSLILWSIIFGVYGLFLAVPFSLAVNEVIKRSNFSFMTSEAA